MTKTLADLRAQKQEKMKYAANILDLNGALTKEQQKAIEEIYATIDDIEATIALREAHAKRAFDENPASDPVVNREMRRPLREMSDIQPRAMDRAERSGRSVDEEAHHIIAERAAMVAFMRAGKDGFGLLSDPLAQDVFRSLAAGVVPRGAGAPKINAMGISTSAAGGALVPTEIYQNVIERLKAYGGMRTVANVITTASGNPLQYATTDDTSNTGELVAEATQANTQDVSFSTVSLNAYKFGSKIVPISIELMQDEAVNILPELYRLLGIRMGRIQNTYFTTGTGTSHPQGVVTAASLGKTGTTGQTTSIIYDDVVDLVHSVDPAYRPGSGFMLHDGSVKILKKLKDGQGRPLWQPYSDSGLATSFKGQIFDYDYVINQDMPVMAANAKSVLFGNFSLYTIRDVMAMTMYRFDDSAYMGKGQVGFLTWMRSDGRAILASNTAAISYYANSAT